MMTDRETLERSQEEGGRDGQPKPRRTPWPRYQRAALGLRNYWYPALLSRDVGRKPVPFKLLGEDLVLVRRDGNVYCLQGRCPHRGFPLSAGRFEFPCTITCMYHGWTYDLATGELVAALTDGPDSPVVGKVKLRTYPAIERQGVVWVFLGDTQPPPLEADVPPEFFDPKAIVWPADPTPREGNWRMGIEGSLDPSHSQYIHRFSPAMWFRRMPGSKANYSVHIEGEYFTYRTQGTLNEADFPGLGRWPRQRWWQRPRSPAPVVKGRLPSLAVVTNQPEPGVVSYNWHVPVDENHWRYMHFQVAWATGVKKWWFKLKHFFVWGPLIQGLFLNQDRWTTRECTVFYNSHDGWEKERLFRPDIVITAWRKYVEENARGFQQENAPR